MIDLLESAALSVFIAVPARARCWREGLVPQIVLSMSLALSIEA